LASRANYTGAATRLDRLVNVSFGLGDFFSVARRTGRIGYGRHARGALAASLAAALGVAAVLWSQPGLAQNVLGQSVLGQNRQLPSKDVPLVFAADEVTYDKTLEIVTLRGRVEIFQNDRILTADTVSYNRKAEIMSASGHVSVMEPTGEVVFANYMEITGDLKNGVARDIRVLMTDNSRFAANGGTLRNGERTLLTQAVFSPCDLCKKDPDRAPLWQLKANKVLHDRTTRNVYYEDVTLEMWGIPIAYAPSFSHADPTVKRRTGVLAPEFGGSSRYGLWATLPYYWDINGHSDLTVYPRVYTSGLPQLGLEYRHRFSFGSLEAFGSGTYSQVDDLSPRKDFRGHIDAKGNFELSDVWRTGFTLQRSTDETYMRRYGYNAPAYLTSQAFVEGFSRRSYANFRSYAFQELRQDLNDRDMPVVAPLLQLDMTGDPDRLGGHYIFQAEAANIYRRDGVDSNKLSAKIGWTKPYIGGWGDVWNFTATVQGDIYNVDRIDHPVVPGRSFSGVVGRILPQATLDWRWPFVRNGGDGNYQVVEPMVSVSVAPSIGSQWRIPNENAQDIVFDETNLFNANRFVGSDRLEGGQRVTYGMKFGLFGAGGGASTLFIGQSYRLNDKQAFVDNQTSSNLSDVIAAVSINPGQFWDGFARLRFDSEKLNVRQADLLTNIGPKSFRVSLNYLFIDDTLVAPNDFGDRQEFNFGVTSQLTDHWSVGAVWSHDLENQKTRYYGGRLKYEDECFIFALDAQRRLYKDREIDPDFRVLLQVVFKQFTSLNSRVF
jgi:LPS-assembly protein